MDEEQPVFEQLTLSEFKLSSSAAWKTFNNYNIIMTNIRHSNDFGAVFDVVNFWVNSAGCSGEFHVVVEHFEDISRISYWTFLKRKWPSLPSRTFINSKSYIASCSSIGELTKIKLARVLVEVIDKSHHLCALHIFGHH